MTCNADRFQSAVNQIRVLCNDLGVVLIGVCEAEGIYGEIAIQDASGAMDPNDVAALTNKVAAFNFDDGLYVRGIGDSR